MRKLLIPLLLAATTLSACATAERLDAAGDVHDLLVAIRDNDRATFNNHVDRKALKASIESRLVREAQKTDMDDKLKALTALLAPTLADVAGDALIQPKVFRGVANYYGYTPDKPIPGRLAIGAALKAMPDGRVCATKKKDGPCVLIFTREDGAWKLSGFEGDISDLRTKAAR
ncbi:hypothetical protein QO010_003005 [Caulobacter ginsengisoli]|uniref:DUF2939 domain-containing protein n=1 Tax=Caulobacter ginsengisoli TaxID=400775 RepID=A0ABU0IT87_9CAUL|nr:DUF2939 domain-containing protein [Caulobacter ginsengisoli]MDQ0465218.1 hypothetical protein [Caulobacter ginsengisoli]